jgi:hypothetical protein
LLLSCREPPQQAFHKGCIREYDSDHDCFIVWCEDGGQYAALQFKQFVVEASGGQLVLKVPACTRQPLPAPYWSAGAGEGASQDAGASKCLLSRFVTTVLCANMPNSMIWQSAVLWSCLLHD